MTHFLAKDFSEIQIESTNCFLLLFDAYDQNVRGNVYDWLYDFLKHFDKGIFVVASREILPWNNNLNIKVKHFYLDTIPEGYIRSEFEKREFTPKDIDNVISITECIPIYLSLMLQGEDYNKNNPPQITSKAEIIDRFLSHFSDTEIKIVNYISVIEYFSESSVDHIQDYFNISLQQDFESISHLSLFRYVENEHSVYRLHSILAENISQILTKRQKEKILDDYLKFISLRMIYDERPTGEKSIIITNLYNKFYHYHIEINDKEGEQLLKIYFFLVSYGKEGSLLLSINDYCEEKMTPAFKSIIMYIKARDERKRNIQNGLHTMSVIIKDNPPFGKYIKAIQCDINYLRSISGNYERAYVDMEGFVNSLNKSEIMERYYFKGYTYFYDMLMLKGRFKKAIKGFLELEQNYEETDFDFYEVRKAIGHCYRFCFLFDEALTQYNTYKKDTTDKIYGLTTLCETLCYMDPDKVYDIYIEAKRINENAHNHNNLGKIANAYALAQIFTKDSDMTEINDLILESHDEFNKTGYLSGHLFTWQTECFFAYARGDKKSIKELARKMQESINQLYGVYGYLMLPVYRMLNMHKEIEKMQSLYEWPDFQKSLNTLDAYLKCLQDR